MSIPDNPEILLAQKAAHGDNEAFTALFQQYFQAVYNYAAALCNDPAEAEDLTQEAFIRAHTSLPQFGAPWNFRTWIFRMTRNLFLDELRKRRPVISLDDATLISAPLPSPESLVMLNDVAGRVRQTLNSLSARNKEALVLREIHGLSYAEIAEVLDTTPAYTKTLLARSRAEFQEAYGIRLLVEEPSEDCHEVGELLQLYHDGEISEGAEPFVREHLKTCQACQKRRNWLITQSGLLAALMPVLPPAGLAGRTLVRIGLHEKPGAPPPPPSPARRFDPLEFFRTHPWETILAGGGLVIIIGAGLFLFGLGWMFFFGPHGRFVATASPVATPFEFSVLPSGTPEDFLTANAPIVAADTLTPTQTPTPTFSPPMFLFTQNANCRRGPGTVYPVVTSFLDGRSVQIDGRNQSLPRWWWVLIPNSSQHCWVSDSAGTTEGDPESLPVKPAPPTPSVTPKPGVDFDKDGYPFGVDCDDKKDKIHPGAFETPGDGIDSNCNGKDDS